MSVSFETNPTPVVSDNIFFVKFQDTSHIFLGSCKLLIDGIESDAEGYGFDIILFYNVLVSSKGLLNYSIVNGDYTYNGTLNVE